MVVRLHECYLGLIWTSETLGGGSYVEYLIRKHNNPSKGLDWRRCCWNTNLRYLKVYMLVEFDWTPSPFAEGPCLTSCPLYPYIFLALSRSRVLFIWCGLLVLSSWIHACTNTLILWALSCFGSIKAFKPFIGHHYGSIHI